jgi:hypothetical protein
MPSGSNLPSKRYLHAPLVLGGNGEKRSKQKNAQAQDTAQPIAVRNTAAQVLGHQPCISKVADALLRWTTHWKAL